MTNVVIEHFERFLGQANFGWSRDSDGNELPFQIVQLVGKGVRDWVAYATVGLSRHVTSAPSTYKAVRQEVMMLMPADFLSDSVVSVLAQVGKTIIKSHRALLRGNVIGPASLLFPTGALTALYVSIPVYFPPEFAAFHDGQGTVVVEWLIPITTSEADFIADNGWVSFEELLDDQGPNLIDPLRSSLVLSRR